MRLLSSQIAAAFSECRRKKVDTSEILYIMSIYNMKDITKGERIMDIIISNSGGEPIYYQISEQIKAMILSGRLKEGDPLPSMRLLAKELRISVITTKRAYEELERQGFLTSIPGKGSFVTAANLELIRETHLRQIEELLQEAVKLAPGCGLQLPELVEMLTIFYEGE